MKAPRFQLLSKSPSVEFGQLHIEHDEAGMTLFDQVERLRAISGFTHRVAAAQQRQNQNVTERWVVIHDENRAALSGHDLLSSRFDHRPADRYNLTQRLARGHEDFFIPRSRMTRWSRDQMKGPHSLPARKSARVLVMLDQPLLAEIVKFTLNHGVYQTRTVTTVEDAMAVLNEWDPHIVVVDMDIGGDRIVEQTHGLNGLPVPVLALTRRGDLKTKLAAFEQGVDDIMTVPFSPEELLARVLALTRRTYGAGPALNPVIKLGEIEIDILNRKIRAGTSELHLTPLEQSLLYLLAANAGRVLTRDEIMDALWGVDFVAGSNTIDQHIRSLRAKLQNDWHRPRFIATEAGRGYRFVPTFSEQLA